MEDIVNIRTFVSQLSSYIKICIYANKGTENDNMLNKNIRLYNKYKLMDVPEMQSADETFIKKCMVRLNLILKIDKDKNPIDIKVKENQLQLINLDGHDSLANNKINDMIEHATKHNIDILSGVPLTFYLIKGPYQTLLWQYTRSLYYMSQIYFTMNNANNATKKQIFDDASEKIIEILSMIEQLEDENKVKQLLALDVFLNNKLVKSGITESNIHGAKDEVKELFAKKGLGNNTAMSKMIDSISEKLSTIDLSNGNIMQCMFGIAQNVAEELRGDMENDPEALQNTFGAITEVFQDAMSNSAANGDEIPAELSGMMNNILNMNQPQDDFA